MTFFVAVTKNSEKTTWGEKESYSLALWCSPSWWGRSNKQELETAVHLSTTVRRPTVTRTAGLGYTTSRTAPSDLFSSNKSSIPKVYTTFQKVPPAGNQVTKHINLWDFVFHISYSNYISFLYWCASLQLTSLESQSVSLCTASSLKLDSCLLRALHKPIFKPTL